MRYKHSYGSNRTKRMQTIIASAAVHNVLLVITGHESSTGLKYRSSSEDLFSVMPNNTEHSNSAWSVITDNQVGKKNTCVCLESQQRWGRNGFCPPVSGPISSSPWNEKKNERRQTSQRRRLSTSHYYTDKSHKFVVRQMYVKKRLKWERLSFRFAFYVTS